MGVDVYFGFRVRDETNDYVTFWVDEDLQRMADFVSVALDTEFTLEDLTVFQKLMDLYHKARGELGYSWYKVVSEHPLWRFPCPQAKINGRHYNDFVHMCIEGLNGSTTDQATIRMFLKWLGLHEDAASLVDEIYWD